jgi:hypothetical protein
VAGFCLLRSVPWGVSVGLVARGCCPGVATVPQSDTTKTCTADSDEWLATSFASGESDPPSKKLKASGCKDTSQAKRRRRNACEFAAAAARHGLATQL